VYNKLVYTVIQTRLTIQAVICSTALFWILFNWFMTRESLNFVFFQAIFFLLQPITAFDES